jgi:hypothetical protein
VEEAEWRRRCGGGPVEEVSRCGGLQQCEGAGTGGAAALCACVALARAAL